LRARASAGAAQSAVATRAAVTASTRLQGIAVCLSSALGRNTGKDRLWALLAKFLQDVFAQQIGIALAAWIDRCRW
jgi:hypothetical protein